MFTRVYTRENLYKGYVRNQKNGGYDGRTRDIKIINKIIGLNVVTVKKLFVKLKDGELNQGELEMTLFELRDRKVAKIFEYW